MSAMPYAKILIASLLLSSTAAQAQPAQKPESQAPEASAAPGAPAPLIVLFKSGSATIDAKDDAVLDRASRAYNEGRPIVMILTGTTDKVGLPRANLSLSQRRATAVLNGLLARGIPAERFQIVAKGETESPVPTATNVSEARNRRVEITWR